MKRAGGLALFLAVVWGGGPAGLQAQTDSVPRAGESYSGSFLGIPVEIPSRDRRSVSYIAAALLSASGAAESHRNVPAGELFLWRNREATGELCRAELAVIANSIRCNRPLSGTGMEYVGTLETSTLPWSFSDSIEGVRDTPAALKFRWGRGGIGVGWRRALPPGLQDNFVEAALTIEEGYLSFARSSDTASDFLLPADTPETRGHFRLRADAFERNLLELPHAGWAAGLDARAGRRSRWRDWGGGAFGTHAGDVGREWTSVSGYALAASGVPFLGDERHRAIVSAYAGTSSGLDRFSSPRLDGFSNAGDWEALSRPVLPGAASDEFFPARYALANVEYRYQAAVFLFLQTRGTLAWVDSPRFTATGNVRTRMEPLPGITAAVTSGFFWNMSLEIAWSHNFGIRRTGTAGSSEKGSDALYVSMAKLLP